MEGLADEHSKQRPGHQVRSTVRLPLRQSRFGFTFPPCFSLRPWTQTPHTRLNRVAVRIASCSNCA